jgi:hypothetical protein
VAEDDFITSAQDTCFDNGDDFSITFLDFSIISCLSTQGTRNKEQGGAWARRRKEHGDKEHGARCKEGGRARAMRSKNNEQQELEESRLVEENQQQQVMA